VIGFRLSVVGLDDQELQNREPITDNEGRNEIFMATATVRKKLDAGSYQLKDQVVAINRVTKVVKGGKNLSFAALVVVGDPSAAVVGYGAGKAKEVPQAIRKGIESAKKNLVRVNLTQTTIPHAVLGRFGSGMVLLKPAPEGTGVIAGGAVRAVMTSAGVQNVLTKSIGTTNPHNVVKATFDALKKLRDKQEVASIRGKAAEEL
jgi:small subunit ribosomal protein S5